MNKALPMPIAITLGDPAGIGPYVTEKALQAWLPQHEDVPLVLCGPSNLVQAMEQRLKAVVPKAVLSTCCQAPFLGPQAIASAASGQAALQAVEAAVAMANRGEVMALVTAPLSKQALSMAGSAWLGHTELLAHHLASGPVAMAFFSDALRVVLATVHIPFKDIIKALTPQRVLEVTTLLHQALVDHVKIAKPRLALAGLNPHASEFGLLGDEEQTILLPAQQQALACGINLSPPLAADTVFTRALAGEFDGVVALYHDQGLIPVKVLSFGQAVNVTLGLRVVRTSPDHGTAYDKVGSKQIQHEGMLAALQTAYDLCKSRLTRGLHAVA